MANPGSNAYRDGRPLSQVVIAFDLDNTLLDPSGIAYTKTTDDFLSTVDQGLNLSEGRQAYETLRSWGPALARIGLANPIHRRGHPEAVAVLHIIFCTNTSVLAELGIDRCDRQGFRGVIEETVRLVRAVGADWTEAGLESEIRIRRFLRQDKRVDRFRSVARRIAGHPRIIACAKAHRMIERRLASGESGSLLNDLVSKGAIPIVITKGYRDVQFDKLDQLGISHLLTGRVLTTEAAAEVPGAAVLNARLDRLIDEHSDTHREGFGEELLLLWRFRRLIDAWASKTPPFFGRCLHAIRRMPNDPESAMARPEFVAADAWRNEPLRFVMVGDRYDTDIEPLLDLLGPGAGMTIHLRTGKYAHLHPQADLPCDRRPNRTFTDWESLARFLSDDLSAEQIRPITAPPDMVDRSRVDVATLECGLASEFEAIRLIAQAAMVGSAHPAT